MRHQLARFARLFVMGAVPAELTYLAGGSKVTLAAVVALAIPTLETAWRAAFPTVPANTAVPRAPSEPR